MLRSLLLVFLVAIVALPAAALAAEPRFSLGELESELMCPICQSRLDISKSPAADRIRLFVETKRQLGWSKEQVKTALVVDLGPAVLAAPPARGLGLVAWLVPAVVVAVGLLIVVALALLWRRRRDELGVASTVITDAALDARIDSALDRLDDEPR